VGKVSHLEPGGQVFVIASVGAAVIALAVALASAPSDGTSWNRFLGPSRQLDPFINFGSAFVLVLPLFLGYYHLARLGTLLGVTVSAVMLFATQLCAGFLFVFQVVGNSVLVQEITYVAVWLALSMLILWVHLQAFPFPRHQGCAGVAASGPLRNR
jgi:hypothetical protein